MGKESELLQRLAAEAEPYAEGSYLRALCTDAGERIQALEKLVEGGDIGRKVMGADLDGKTRLVDDYCDRVKELEGKVENAVEIIAKTALELDAKVDECEGLEGTLLEAWSRIEKLENKYVK